MKNKLFTVAAVLCGMAVSVLAGVNNPPTGVISGATLSNPTFTGIVDSTNLTARIAAAVEPAVRFPDTNTPFVTCFNGTGGTNTVIEGPSAVASGDGNYLVGFRVAGLDDSTIGSVGYIKVAPSGAVLSTNILFKDSYYDSENVVIFRTASNALLVWFNLYEYQTLRTPSNCVRCLRAEYPWTSWTTNTLMTTGTISGGINYAIGGAAAQTATGRILISCYSVGISYLYSSDDNGVTWSAPGPAGSWVDLESVGSGYGAQEASLCSLGSNTVFASVRAPGGDGSVACFTLESFDNGATWTTPVLAFPAASKIDVVRLASGILLASYRSPYPVYAQAVRTSLDGGATWSGERIVDSRYWIQNYSSVVELNAGQARMFYAYITDHIETNSPLFYRDGTYGGALLATQAAYAVTAGIAGSISNQGSAATASVAYVVSQVPPSTGITNGATAQLTLTNSTLVAARVDDGSALSNQWCAAVPYFYNTAGSRADSWISTAEGYGFQISTNTSLYGFTPFFNNGATAVVSITSGGFGGGVSSNIAFAVQLYSKVSHTYSASVTGEVFCTGNYLDFVTTFPPIACPTTCRWKRRCWSSPMRARCMRSIAA